MNLLDTEAIDIWKLFAEAPVFSRYITIAGILALLAPLFLLRVLPFLLATIGWILNLFAIAVADLLVFPESLLSSRIRNRRKTLPLLIYAYGGALRFLVCGGDSIARGLKNLLTHSLRFPWLPPKHWLFGLSLALLVSWIYQPAMKQLEAAHQDYIIRSQNHPARRTPAQFVGDYFNTIKAENYSTAWTYLSPAFQNRNDYNSYTDWWRKANQGDLIVNTILPRSTSNDTSEVDVKFQYQGKKRIIHISLRLMLIKTSGRNDWLIDRSNELNFSG